ncbi:hypothetical protein PR003_g13310 [Phytophthora rubi]|uniref:Uncharacterized protein n=1 Tax=Phytophthora rubi TaxID=129364 RepID=A0A6A4FHR8_9STRA|nr:hypothetical protein PR002_g12826 [Phytophthora rubi]KAE9024926.1 hypothetical protein PR001_g12553 [Phytophthora rubi]KAE9334860.1 hypothetical protein PR003_g13310 [Phytophthora rubi]
MAMSAFLQQAPLLLASANALSGVSVQVISTDNATRKHVNDTAVPIATRALANSRKILPDSRTGNIPVFLKAYGGMLVCVKVNQGSVVGVAEGTTGKYCARIAYLNDLRSGTQFERKADGIWINSTTPTNLFVDIRHQGSQGRFRGILESWSASVMPDVHTRSTFLFTNDTISIKGFPVVPAFGTTKVMCARAKP